MGWAEDLDKICKKGGEDIGEFAKALKIEIFSGIVSDTRVDTGRLRGNWQIQENMPASGTLDIEDSTPEGQVPAYMEKEIIEGSSPNGITYFTNNLPYASVWEEKDAMVGRNVARARQNVKEIASKIK